MEQAVIPHEFTRAEQAKGGSRTKFNNLKHGRYAKKLSQAYVCPDCHTPVSAGKIREQDVLIAKYASKEGIYAEIKRNLVLMDEILSTADDSREQFLMAEKINGQLMKIWENAQETATNEEPFMKQILDRIKGEK